MTPDQANTTVSDDDLLPCPFCGGKARMEYYASTAVECTGCLVTMDGLFSSPELAVAAWNRRATAEVTEAEIRAQCEIIRLDSDEDADKAVEQIVAILAALKPAHK